MEPVISAPRIEHLRRCPHHARPSPAASNPSLSRRAMHPLILSCLFLLLSYTLVESANTTAANNPRAPSQLPPPQYSNKDLRSEVDKKKVEVDGDEQQEDDHAGHDHEHHDGHHHDGHGHPLDEYRAEDGESSFDNGKDARNETDGKRVIPKRKEARVFIKELFKKYGTEGVMTYEGFEHLLENIGMAKIKIDDHDIHDHHTENGFKEFHPNHNHTSPEHDHSHDGHTHHDHDHDHDHDHADHSNDQGIVEQEGSNCSCTLSDPTAGGNLASSQDTASLPENRNKRAVDVTRKCLTAVEILELYDIPSEKGITQQDFMHLCPSIIYQMDEQMCPYRQQGACAPISQNVHHSHGHDHVSNTSVSKSKISFYNVPGKVWGYAVLAVTIISLVGLFSVAIIPVMQKVFYNHLLQFLVALAVGSLTGDAMLHLIPHSMVPHTSHGEDDHGHSHGEDGGHSHEAMWKGMMVLAGVYIFFIAERLMTMLTDWKRKRAKKHTKQQKDAHVCQLPNTEDQSLGEGVRKVRNGKEKMQETVGAKLSGHDDYYASCQDFVMVVHSSKGMKKMAEDHQEELKGLKDIEEECEEEHHETFSHGHSHGGHGHSHGPPPTSISSIAWMVIMGDGLHNFSDGLAIGASFANGITGGLSTSIAVFCHELPHELGDFAVLLQAGMPVKQALFYNIVSSVLCFLGMVIGVLVGNIGSVSLWIFALTGGMFIYISLVDMLPEITAVHERPGEGRCCHLLLQCLGITTGISIMMIIALYEDKIALNLGVDAFS